MIRTQTELHTCLDYESGESGRRCTGEFGPPMTAFCDALIDEARPSFQQR